MQSYVWTMKLDLLRLRRRLPLSPMHFNERGKGDRAGRSLGWLHEIASANSCRKTLFIYSVRD
jgi:hypothetical protein